MPTPGHRHDSSTATSARTVPIARCEHDSDACSMCIDSNFFSTENNSVRSAAFKQRVQDLIDDSTISTDQISMKATQLIDALKGTLYDVPAWLKIYGGNGLHPVLRAMLTCAYDCGGESSRRYTASAICACSRDGEPTSDTTLDRLKNLAETWYSHFLWIFRSNGSYIPPSEDATPTFQDTCSILGVKSTNNTEVTRDKVVRREGYRCVVSGVADLALSVRGELQIDLDCARLLNPVVAEFNYDRPNNPIYRSAVSTWDILRQYGSISAEEMQEIVTNIGDPSNGIALEANAHKAFDKFWWCLKPTIVENEYTIKSYSPFRIFWNPPPERIVFTDRSPVTAGSGSTQNAVRDTRSGAAAGSSSGSTSFSGIPLPNPKLIRLHAAVAGILHMSGAAEVFDSILKDMRSDGPAVRSGDDFLAKMQHVEIREALRHVLLTH